jgi:hypothetical protein
MEAKWSGFGNLGNKSMLPFLFFIANQMLYKLLKYLALQQKPLYLQYALTYIDIFVLF